MKIGMIYQPCGLGDILFLQKIAHMMKNNGYEVYWPVVHEFKWLSDYIPFFNFISWQDEVNHLTVPPLPAQVEFPRKNDYSPNTLTQITEDFFYFQGFGNHSPIMAGKYNQLQIDWKDWREYIIFNRNLDKENDLYYNVLKLSDNEEYVFVNRNYRTRPNKCVFNNISINPQDYGCRVVELNIMDNFSIFDWCKVIENARSINMISTSLNYLLESPQMFNKVKDKQLTLNTIEGHFNEVSYLFNLPWNYVC